MALLKLNPVAFGITLGGLSGLSIFGIGIVLHTFFPGLPIGGAIGTLYITYNPSFLNSFVCGALGFMGGAISGYIFARLYNILTDLV